MTAVTAPDARSKRAKPGQSRRIISRTVIYGRSIIAAIIFLIPVYMVLVTSFKSIDQVGVSTMWAFPTSFTLDSFTRAFELLSPNLITVRFWSPSRCRFGPAILGSLNGYVLSKWKFPGANIIFPLMLFGMFIAIRN